MRLSPLFLAPLLVSPGLLAQRFAEIEPNDTVAAAQAIAVGTQIDSTLSVSGDSDW